MDEARFRLDPLDRAILAVLRRDARAPVARIAAAVGATRGTVQKRIDRLQETGVILGFTVRLRAEAAGEVRAVMMVSVSGRSTGQVIARLRGLPELHALHTTNGKWDLVAELRCADLAEFDRVLRAVRLTEGVADSETSLLLSSV